METTRLCRYDNNEYIYLSLLHLGAVMWNVSSKRLLLALQYAAAHSTVTEDPVKHLYTELASSQKCTYSVIERSLRYAIGCIWNRHLDECVRLLYHSSDAVRCPSPLEFIHLYDAAFRRGIIQAWVDSVEESAEH